MTAGKRNTTEKRRSLTRYEHPTDKDLVTPETGHTPLLAEESPSTLELSQRAFAALEVMDAPDGRRQIVVDMDPAVDPLLFWAGKSNLFELPALPLQRTEVVAESRIARVARRAAARQTAPSSQQTLFADIEKHQRDADKAKRIEFYVHEEEWKNKLICGDSLAVMESLMRFEGMRGRVQAIYMDPPYGIKYDSNFQQRVDTTKNEGGDTADDVLTIKAYRDSWTLGVHSYLSHLYERLYLCRELLGESGSVFVQISEHAVHLVRVLLDEIFGASNYMSLVTFRKKMMPLGARHLETVSDYILWYARNKDAVKFRRLYRPKRAEGDAAWNWVELPDGSRRRLTAEETQNHSILPAGARIFQPISLLPAGFNPTGVFEFQAGGKKFAPPPGKSWGTSPKGMQRLVDANRIFTESRVPRYVYYLEDSPVTVLTDNWADTTPATNKVFAVQTQEDVVARCLLMSTDPADLVFDPTCGGGTTAVVAETYGRRWITCDTSRVSINVARQRLLSLTMPHFRLRGETPREGFHYEGVPHVTMGSIANGLEPERVELVDQPEVDTSSIRVTGPFEVLALGRYSIRDWEGYVATGSSIDQLEDYIATISRLYRANASLTKSGGIVHSVDESEKGAIGISVGPISGRVTARQLYDSARDASSLGIGEIHVLGWAFEANLGEVTARLQEETGVRIRLVMIRPDTLVEGLKVTDPESLFSPFALPDVEIAAGGDGQFTVTLNGVAVFDRKHKTTEFKAADSGYVAAWYLDEDYDGDCFVDCQMFFDFKKKPAIEKTLGIEVDPEEWTLRLTSDPFEAGKYRKVAVKVVDVYGNESTVVRDLP